MALAGLLDNVGIEADTFDKVIAGIRKLPESQRVGVMVELVGLEHSDTLAKLVDKPEELARQRELANGTAAKGSMRREADARNQTTSAQWIMAKNRAFELTTTLGEALKPALVDIMTTLGAMASKLAAFAAAHPGLVSFILKAAAALSVLLVVGGTVTVALASLIGPFALLRYGMAMMSISGVSVVSVIGRIGTALRIAGQAVLWIGRALMTTPIGLAITAIALAAFLLIRYWEPIKAFFGGIWNSNYVGQIASSAVTPEGRQAAAASVTSSARVAAMRASEDPYQRALASGCIPGLGASGDSAKTGRILKPAKL